MLGHLQERLSDQGRVYVLDRVANAKMTHREASHRRMIPIPLVIDEMKQAGLEPVIQDQTAPLKPNQVNLQILPAGQIQPRVFVVQRRKVEVSEWEYDPNPDTASFIHSLSVRPVIGVPWSEENEALFESLGPGATFSIRLNTGAVQQFDFASKTEVSRIDTSAAGPAAWASSVTITTR